MTGDHTRRLAFDLLDSTNAEALRLAANGERGPLWIDAAAQSSGRGRSGREWLSAPGNLLTSYLFSTSARPEATSQLSLVAGVAAYQAVVHVAPRAPNQLKLKWPNDLLLGTAKVGGILVETTNFGDQSVAVIGIGINTANAPKIGGVETADLTSVIDDPVDLSQMRDVLAETFGVWLATWAEGAGFAGVREAWLKFGTPIGEPLTVVQEKDVYHGTFAGLDDQGSLCLLHPSGETHCYRHGDVSVISPKYDDLS